MRDLYYAVERYMGGAVLFSTREGALLRLIRFGEERRQLPHGYDLQRSGGPGANLLLARQDQDTAVPHPL